MILAVVLRELFDRAVVVVQDSEQSVGVLVFGGEAQPNHIIAVLHELETFTLHIGVGLSCFDVVGLPRRKFSVLQKQTHQYADIIRKLVVGCLQKLFPAFK